MMHCKKCDKEFYAKPYFVRKGQGIFCSSTCQYADRKKGKIVPCFVCGKESYKQLHDILGTKSGKFFCGKSCQTKWRNQEFAGLKHANWKEGLFAYRSVLTRSKVPKVCGLCETDDARVMAVHHIDRDRRNNNVSNLAWLCHNCHFLVHHDQKEAKKFETLHAKRK